MEKDILINSIKEEFSFLQNLGFSFHGIEDSSRNLYVFFKSNSLLVEVQYNRPNNFIEITIYNTPSVDCRFTEGWKRSINLNWLIKKYEPNNRIKENNLNLEEILKYKASLLKQYGELILSGKEWFSWGDVSGWRPGNKAHITLGYIKGKSEEDKT